MFENISGAHVLIIVSFVLIAAGFAALLTYLLVSVARSSKRRADAAEAAAREGRPLDN